MTTVYFVPFDIETYVPITRSTIMSIAWEKWTISSESETSRLINLLSYGVEGKFDEGKVRALVLSNNKAYFIDSSGVALIDSNWAVLEGKPGVRIDKAEFVKFRDSLRADERQMLRK